ncbi:MAG: hypothetical protein Q9167_005263, partial [Letrouitia subvulpina]
IDSSGNRVDYVTVGDVLYDLTKNWTGDFSNDLFDDSEPRFAIYHPDLSVNNIFVDEEFNVTCIIDWAFSSTVPLSTLLTAPGLPQSRHELDVSLSSMFELEFQHALKESTTSRDIGTNSNLCEVLSRSRPMWLFSRVLTFDSVADFHLFQAIWDLLGNSSQSAAELIHSKQTLQKYKLLHSELKEDDQTKSQIAKLESEYFSNNIEGLAIARKLILVSEWTSRYCEPRIRSNSNTFVADKRLWHWIRNCFPETIWH